MSESTFKFSSTFNVVVRRHRLAQELSQEALSERAEVDRTYVGLLERGYRGAGLDVAKRLADALGLTLTDLIAEAEAEWQKSPRQDRRPAPAASKSARKSSRSRKGQSRQHEDH